MNKVLRIVLILLFSAVLIYSLTKIVLIELEYKKADDIYADSRTAHFHVSEDPSDSGTLGQADSTKDASDEEYFPFAVADVAELQAINPEVAGWLWIPGTTINYPLVQAQDNAKYLSLSYDLQRTNSGSIFMDFRNTADFSDDNTVIYGHNMHSGGMFGSLKEFGEPSYLDTHKYLYVFTSGRILKYRVFAAYKTENTSESYTRDFSAEIDYTSYMDYVFSSAGENLLDAPDKQAPLLMLSTCTSVRRTERFVLHATLVAEKDTETGKITLT